MPRLITAVAAPTFRRPLARLVAPSSALGDLRPVGHKSAAATAPSAAKGRLRLGADATAPSAARGRLRVKADATAPSSAKGAIKSVTPAGYAKARRVIVPHGKVRGGADLANFPFCVQLSGAWLKWVGNDATNGRIQSPNGYDIRFELPDGTKLHHDLELYDGAAGQLVAWVRIPVLSASADTTVWLRYDKTGQATAEENKAGTWRDYLAVIRFPSGADVTGNGRALVPTSVGSGTLVGPAGAFDGAASVAVGALAPWLDGLSAVTIQARCKNGAVPTGGSLLAVRQGDDQSTARGILFAWALSTPVANVANSLVVQLNTSLVGALWEGLANIETTSPVGVAATWASGGQIQAYLGGALLTPGSSQAGTGSLSTFGGKPVVGFTAVTNGPANRRFNGLLDEIRVAAVALTAGRIATEEACIADPAFFYGLGDEEDTSGPSSIVALPVAASGTVGTAGTIDVAAAAFVPTGVANPTISGVGPASDGGAVVVAANKAKYTPAAQGAQRFPFILLSGGKHSGSVCDVAVGPRQQQAYRSGLAWASGLNITGDQFSVTNTINQVREWGAYRGRPVDVVNQKINSSTYATYLSSITSRAAVYQALYDEGVAVQQVWDCVADSEQGDAAFDRVAAGNYDVGTWLPMLRALDGYKRRAPFVIRLQHEWDATGTGAVSNDTTSDHRHWLAAFRHVAGLIRNFGWTPANGPAPLIDWCATRKINTKMSQHLDEYYPGDTYVDIIGVDYYYNKSGIGNITDAASFDAWAKLGTGTDIPQGILAWIDYARRKGKKCGCGEWAVSSNTSDPTWGNRDNPWFIDGMWRAFGGNADVFLYETYFEGFDGNVDHNLKTGAGTINNVGSNALCTAKYKALWTP